jgi:hypothetical protein
LFAVSREAGSETVECPGETSRILFADRIAREAVTYCPECAEREFGQPGDPSASTRNQL